MKPTSLSLLEVFAYTSSILFPLWPLLLLWAIRPRRNLLPAVLAVWILLAVMRVLLILYSLPVVSFLIPEPLNTILFFAAGAGLIALLLGRSLWKRTVILNRLKDARGVTDLLEASPTEFEEMVVEFYRLRGHQARRVGGQGDHGMDVVVKARNGEKWIVQCKRWRGTVGEPQIRDFYGVMQHEKADKGVLITTGTFTPQAQEWARGKPLYLVNGKQFIRALEKERTMQRDEAEPQSVAPPKG